ncbi:uncharacterized protein LOC144581786 [Callithrix jacchus]
MCPLLCNPPTKKDPRPRPNSPQRITRLRCQNLSGKERLRDSKRSSQIPPGKGGKTSPRGVEKVNFKVMQIVMQKKIPFLREARNGARLGVEGPGSRFAGARWRGSYAGREPRGRARGGKPPRAAGCFWSGSPSGMQEARSEPGSFSTSPTLPRNGSPRRRSEPARERCCQAERGGNRERKSFSLITTSSPYLQYKGETK